MRSGPGASPTPCPLEAAAQPAPRLESAGRRHVARRPLQPVARLCGNAAAMPRAARWAPRLAALLPALLLPPLVSACPRIVIKNGKATRASGHYSKYYATCDEGYRLNGPNVLICDQYDKWSTIPTCDLITTPAPPTTTPLTTTPLTTTPLTTTPLTTTPLTTTPLTTTPLTTTPLTTTPLTTTPLTTTSVTEPLPTPDNQTELYIPNGRIIAGPKPPYLIGDNVTIQCYPGFTMYGEPRIQYIGGNQWEPGIPSCRLNVFAIIIISGTLIGAVSLASFKAYKKYFPHEVVPATDDGAEASKNWPLKMFSGLRRSVL
ncbi:mucin-2 [Alligator mississippiensis]|uniref:mucin-2 n=1 Tax=Alligator mississippiensis TaxID=8496 RepID=UPI00287772B0|nr:mucin-2 [Alligator mississippiensis]